MTKKEISTTAENAIDQYHKLSIQVSLNGLSFCVLDTIGQKIALSINKDFGKELSPYEVQRELKELFREHRIADYGFSEVVVVHKNQLFSLVPSALFDEKESANYLKFNAKILANDLIAHDELDGFEMVNVYVPFVNINNYIYDLFGPFDYMHHGTILVQTLLKSHNNGSDSICYAYVSEQQLDLAILAQKKLRYFNSFKFSTKEDFIYYLLFTLEQLKLDVETVKLRLFGTVEEGDPIYNICYEYIQHISIYIPSGSAHTSAPHVDQSIDFTVLNAL